MKKKKQEKNIILLYHWTIFNDIRMYIEQREDILTSRILNNMRFLTQ